MVQARTIQTNFTSGELDPMMAMRVDTGAFTNGAAKLTNCLLYNTGGASARPGTAHLASLTARSRLLPFEFSADQRYIMALSAGRLDVYNTSGTLLTSVTSGCNWTLATLFELTFAQVADTMIVAHRSWRTQIIRRTGASSFTVSNLTFETSIDGNKIYQPYYKFADDAVTLKASASTGTGVTLTASAAVFASSMVGERLRWADTEIEVTGYTSATVMTGTIKGKLELRLDLNPFRSTSGSGIVEVTHVDHGFTTGQNVTLSGANGFAGITAANLSGTFAITVVDEYRYTISTFGTATESADGGGPNVKITSSVTETRNWAEQAFCTRNGWPGAVAFHQGRLWLAGSTGIPDGIWSSWIYRFFNFDVGEGLDNESIQVTVGSDDISNVRHLVSHRELQIFTALGEFYAPSQSDKTLTPNTMQIKRQTPYGCSMVAPQPFDGATLYIQGTETAVREFIYTNTEDGYTSTNLNILSGHLINAPRDMAVLFGSTRRSEQYAIVVNADGTVAVFNSARAENLAGWSPWSTGTGTFDAVCVLGGDVFFSVKRGTTYRIERLTTDAPRSLDGSVTYTDSAAKTVWTVGAVFYGTSVHVTSGNYYLGEFLVGASGQLVLNVAVASITVGYEFDWEVRTLPVNLTLPNGSTVGLPKRISRVLVGLYSTLALSIAGTRMVLRQAGDDFSQAPEPFSGTKEIYLLGYARDPAVSITRQEPLPVTILGLSIEVNA
jgi:hypothetical protein